MQKQIEQKANRIDPKQVKKGDLMVIWQFVRVDGVNQSRYEGTTVNLKDLETGLEFSRKGDDLVARLYSASQYAREEKVSRTEVCEKLLAAGHRPFTVCWDTKDTVNRTAVARYIGNKNIFGYSEIEELQPDGSWGYKQVKHETVHYVIIDNVKWTSKAK